MDLIVLIIFIYAISKALKDARAAWRKSKGAYMRSVDARFPSLPKPRRAARAAQHDLGYWTAHALRGFPHARRGFAAGWQEGRQAKAGGKPLLWRDVNPPKGEVRPAAGTGEGGGDFPVLLKVRSKSGRKINPITGEPHDVATVYDAEDLRRRLAAAAEDPDLDVTTEPLPSPETADSTEGSEGAAGDPHACGNPNGCACPCHGTSAEPELAGLPAHQPSGNQTAMKGTPSMPVAADTTYDGVLTSMSAAKADAEVKAAEAQQASTSAGSLADQMQGVEVDTGTLSAMADHLSAHDDVVKAHQKLYETAEAVEMALKRGHAGLSEAHKDAPVQAAAREFYSE